VEVVLAARYCGDDGRPAQIDAFINGYLSRLSDLVDNVFAGTPPDAYEIGNELNIKDCPDPSLFRVGPNAFGWLLRRVWEWKRANSRPELIISGGLLNTYVTAESYWAEFLGGNALVSPPYSGDRPFDYFGVHPYNMFSYDNTCVNAGGLDCFDSWKSQTTGELQTIAARVNDATGTSDTALFATEFGWQLSGGGACGGDNCTVSAEQMAAAMQASGEAFSDSGVLPFALWYDYRDDLAGPQRFGLRAGWDGARWPARSSVWSQFLSLARGTGGLDPDACW
jgi:hypothetical protein